jgi:hypothetical protein
MRVDVTIGHKRAGLSDLLRIVAAGRGGPDLFAAELSELVDEILALDYRDAAVRVGGLLCAAAELVHLASLALDTDLDAIAATGEELGDDAAAIEAGRQAARADVLGVLATLERIIRDRWEDEPCG